MPATYTLIASNTLSSSAASVTFSSIPGTYTDLVLRFTARTSNAQVYDILKLQFNNSGGTAYSYTRLLGSGSSASSARQSSVDGDYEYMATGANATSSTFGNVEIYIPNYAGNNNKPFSISAVTENNATESYISANAGLWSNTNAINRIDIYPNGTFASGSSFFLYGIKNS